MLLLDFALCAVKLGCCPSKSCGFKILTDFGGKMFVATAVVHLLHFIPIGLVG